MIMASTSESSDDIDVPSFKVPKYQVHFHNSYSKDEILDIESNVKKLVTRILEQTAIEDPFFKLKDIILSGSVSEGLKVRQLNEFDFLLVLNANFKVIEDEDLQPGFVNITSEENLHPFSLRRKFHRALSFALKKLDLDESVLVRIRIRAVSVKLHISSNTLNCPHGDLDIDLVLALKAPDLFWPRCSKDWRERPHNEGLPAEVIEEIVTFGVHFVPRFEYKSDNQAMERQSIKWRVSFSIAESIILRRLTETQRNAFKMMKVILEKQTNMAILEKVSNTFANNFVNKLTTTYHIKTILFHLNEDASLSGLGERNYLIHILKELILSLKNMSLKHYFIPNLNLFSDLEKLASGKLLSSSQEELYKFTVKQYEDLLENLSQDLTELKNEAMLGQVVIRIPPLAPLKSHDI